MNIYSLIPIVCIILSLGYCGNKDTTKKWNTEE